MTQGTATTVLKFANGSELQIANAPASPIRSALPAVDRGAFTRTELPPVTRAVVKLLTEMVHGCPNALTKLVDARASLCDDAVEREFVVGHPTLLPFGNTDSETDAHIGMIGVMQGLIGAEGYTMVFDVDPRTHTLRSIGAKRLP